jgi:8-oxo-dGTP pyrophosphatase MutT (NUDIX family)
VTEGDSIVSIADDLLAEGEPEKEFNPGIASRLPRKRVAAGVIFRDEDSRILMVEPVYKPGLEIPGGIVNENESPLQACAREVHEELGIDPAIGDLLVVDWVPRHGVWPDGVMFVFDGGILPPEQQSRIRLQSDELAAIKYLTLDEIVPHVRPAMARRLRACLDALAAGRPVYLDFGRTPSGSAR